MLNFCYDDSKPWLACAGNMWGGAPEDWNGMGPENAGRFLFSYTFRGWVLRPTKYAEFALPKTIA